MVQQNEKKHTKKPQINIGPLLQRSNIGRLLPVLECCERRSQTDRRKHSYHNQATAQNQNVACALLFGCDNCAVGDLSEVSVHCILTQLNVFQCLICSSGPICGFFSVLLLVLLYYHFC